MITKILKMKYSLLLLLFLTSCGTIKKSFEETEIKKDSLYNKDKEFSLSTGNFTLKPFNPDKPMIIGKDTIVNTIIENHYRTEVIKEKDNGVIKVDLKQEKQSKEVDYSETIKIVANRFIWLIGILFVLMFVLNWIKNKTTLL